MEQTPRARSTARTARSPKGILAGALGVLLVATALSGCSTAPSDTTASGPPSTESTTTSSSTTTSPTTTTWPRTPVAPIPAVGQIPVISRVATTDPVVFLTIDDGMVRDPRVADLLSSMKIPATLFLNEGAYLADPEYFHRVASGGGSINSHTRSHVLLTRLGEAGQRGEICGMRDILSQHMLAPGHLFRAPYGVSNAATQRAAASCGINAILYWHAAINDGRVQFQQGRSLQPGDIVLAHFRADLYDGLQAFLFDAALAGLTVAPIEDYLPLPPA